LSLESKVAVVTGGARGIGAATAIALAEAGASVVIGDLEVEAGRATADVIGEFSSEPTLVERLTPRH